MPYASFAAEQPQSQKLTASERDGDQFGKSVSISSDGNYAVIGGYPVDESSSGTAYVFKKNEDGTWIKQTKLTDKDWTAADRFGISVSISSDGSYVLIGAPDQNDERGAAYVFEKPDAGWDSDSEIDVYSAKLTPITNDDSNEGTAGNSVSISSDGTYAFVAASTYNSDNGAVYVFKKPNGGWSGTIITSTAMLTAEQNNDDDYFGRSISLSSGGNYALVGADGHVGGGAAYVFKQPDGGWDGNITEYDAKLTAASLAIMPILAGP